MRNDIKTGESIWKGLIKKALSKALLRLFKKTLENVYNGL